MIIAAKWIVVTFIFIMLLLYVIDTNHRITEMTESIPIWIQDAGDTNQYYSLEDRLIILEEDVNKLKQK